VRVRVSGHEPGPGHDGWEQRFARISNAKVVPIRVPAFGNGVSILPLANHFLNQFNRAFSKNFQSIDSEPSGSSSPIHAGEYQGATAPVRADVIWNRAIGSRRISTPPIAARAGRPGLAAGDPPRGEESGRFREGIDFENAMGEVDAADDPARGPWTQGEIEQDGAILR